MRLRQLIAGKLPSYELSGEVEADESYFGGACKGKRGRGAAGKVPVFGLLKRGSKVYTDYFKAYNAHDVSEFHHRRINHSTLFADQTNHINGIENFWNQAKRHMRQFNGVKKENFYWFLKELIM
jgi:transposase